MEFLEFTELWQRRKIYQKCIRLTKLVIVDSRCVGANVWEKIQVKLAVDLKNSGKNGYRGMFCWWRLTAAKKGDVELAKLKVAGVRGSW